MKRGVVIGGGLGGIAAALRLQKRGWAVTVCEAGETFGGKMNCRRAEGFHFDTGPSLLTMPWVFEDLFESAGCRMDDHVKLLPLQPLAEYVFDDGARLTYSSVLPQWIETVRQIEPRDVDGFFRFLKLGARLYEVSERTFLRRTPLARPERGDLRALRHLPIRHGWGNYHAAVAAHFRSPYLRQLYDRYPTYVGSSPFASPATLAVIPYIEFAFGGYSVEGGLYRIVESLVAIGERLGVRFSASSRVVRIAHQDQRVNGVELESGAVLPADVVVMNGDAATAPELFGEPAPQAADRSLSGLVFLFGLRRELPGIQQNSIFFSADYKAEFTQLFRERKFPDDPTVYVNAPEGQATLFIMANAPAGGSWDAHSICDAQRRVFTRLKKGGFPEFRQDIVVSDIWTPSRIADTYNCPGGAIYGTHSHGWRNAFLRPPNRSRTHRGLYFAGGSAHPGGGTPTVLLSARIACELIERFEN